MSTTIIGNALHNIIEEVNQVQEDPVLDLGGQKIPMSALLGEASRYEKMQSIKNALQQAWNATKIMDTFDMEPSFKSERYNKNRSILRGLCQQVGISTSSYVPRSTSTWQFFFSPKLWFQLWLKFIIKYFKIFKFIIVIFR